MSSKRGNHNFTRSRSPMRLRIPPRRNNNIGSSDRAPSRGRLPSFPDEMPRGRQTSRNVEYGRPGKNSHHSYSDGEEDASDINQLCSPTAWIMQVGKECGSNASSVLSSISSLHSPSKTNEERYSYDVPIRKPGTTGIKFQSCIF